MRLNSTKLIEHLRDSSEASADSHNFSISSDHTNCACIVEFMDRQITETGFELSKIDSRAFSKITSLDLPHKSMEPSVSSELEEL